MKINRQRECWTKNEKDGTYVQVRKKGWRLPVTTAYELRVEVTMKIIINIRVGTAGRSCSDTWRDQRRNMIPWYLYFFTFLIRVRTEREEHTHSRSFSWSGFGGYSILPNYTSSGGSRTPTGRSNGLMWKSHTWYVHPSKSVQSSARFTSDTYDHVKHPCL